MKMKFAVGIVILLSLWWSYHIDEQFGEQFNWVFYTPLSRIHAFVAVFIWTALHGLAAVFGVWFIIEFGRALIRWTSTGSGRSAVKLLLRHLDRKINLVVHEW